MFFSFFVQESYFSHFFDLSHFCSVDNKLYQPSNERPRNRLKTAKSGMERKKPPQSGRLTGRKPIVAYKILLVGAKIRLFLNNDVFQPNNCIMRAFGHTIQLAVLYSFRFPPKEPFVTDGFNQQQGIPVFHLSRKFIFG